MPSQDGPNGAPGVTSLPPMLDPSAELAALRSGVRALADIMVRTGRVAEAEMQSTLRQLGVEPLERHTFRMAVRLRGVAYLDVMAADLVEAQVIAGQIVDRGCSSLVSTMLPGGARISQLQRSAVNHWTATPVQLLPGETVLTDEEVTIT